MNDPLPEWHCAAPRDPVSGSEETAVQPASTPGGRRKESLAASRRRSRILTLQALYEADASGHDPAGVVTRLTADEQFAGDSAAFALRLIAGIKRRHQELDERIRAAAPQWPVEQLAAVDRNILRIAIYEMLFENETPTRVAVNEAVELAKAFGSEASSRFVNGVLGGLAKQEQE